MSGGYASSSELLAKQAELKKAQADYDALRTKYTPQTVFTRNRDINAISNITPPPGIEPGEDFGEFWKAIKDRSATKTADTCNTAAANDTRLFKTVVYTGNTGTNISKGWDQQCYGLIHNADDSAVNMTNPGNGYVTSTTPNGYTKLGISSPSDSTNIYEASQLYDLEKKINQLSRDIFILAPSAIDKSLTTLKDGISESETINTKINAYMNTGAGDISANNMKILEKQNRIKIYDDINSQIHLKAYKYRFFIYFFVAFAAVIAALSYASDLSLNEQFESIVKLLEGSWWSKWYVVTFVILLLILSSFGWDMRGNIMTVFRYITDPQFWTGELWWIGVTFLLLIVIFVYTSFKSFFKSITPESMKEIADFD
jgi:hypothetical protein